MQGIIIWWEWNFVSRICTRCYVLSTIPTSRELMAAFRGIPESQHILWMWAKFLARSDHPTYSLSTLVCHAWGYSDDHTACKMTMESICSQTKFWGFETENSCCSSKMIACLEPLKTTLSDGPKPYDTTSDLHSEFSGTCESPSMLSGTACQANTVTRSQWELTMSAVDVRSKQHRVTNNDGVWPFVHQH